MLAKLKLLPNVLLPLSNRALDYYLSLDPDYYHDLQILAGRQVYIYLEDFEMYVQMKFNRTTMQLNYHKAVSLIAEGDLILKGHSIDLLVFALKKAQRSKLLSNKVIQFEGELFLLEAMVKLFKQRNFFKNIPLPPLMKQALLLAFKKANAWQQHAREVAQHTLVDYLQEELHYLPSYQHFKLLQDDLLQLNVQLDRLDAKLNLMNVYF